MTATETTLHTAIEIEDLHVTYRSRQGAFTALDGLDLAVPRGGVFGLLGANGAGKTTAMRAVVGLLPTRRGSIRLLGTSVPKGLPAVIDRVGALIEQPSFFPNFTGRRNLELLARSRGFSMRTVDDALDRVGMTARAGSPYAGYSLGMRQRLGMAAALLKDPELLVLDEPANGLDPSGILQIRTLLRGLAAEGRTVLVSSHLLSEVQQTCDGVAIVDRGRCVASGRVDELLSAGRHSYRVAVAPDDHDRAAAVLRAAGWQVTVDDAGDDGARDGMSVELDGRTSDEITRVLASHDVYVRELTPVTRSLEDVFFETTRKPGGTSS